MRIVIAAGGTAGHVVPALAVAGALRDEDVEVVFIGGERAEARLVPAAGFDLRAISVEGLSRSNPLRAARALARAGRALLHARALLGELRPAAVMGGGGYVSGPVGLAAVLRRVPLVLTEADSHLGLTNRLLAPFARRVCLAFPPSASVDGKGTPGVAIWSPGGRYLRPSMTAPAPGRAWGSVRMRPACWSSVARWEPARSTWRRSRHSPGAAFHVLHVAGHRDYAELAERPRPPGYDLREYMDLGEFADALAAADLAVARAGGSIFEIAAHGLPGHSRPLSPCVLGSPDPSTRAGWPMPARR